MNKTAVLHELKQLLSNDRVSEEREKRKAFANDTWPLKLVKRSFGNESTEPLCVISPTTTEEVSHVLAFLNDKGIPVVPYGGGSSVTGGAEPTKDSVVLNLGEMKEVLHLDTNNLTVTTQPAVIMATLEDWLNKQNYMSGHYPQSIELAQVGGLVSTRSSGQFSTKYGNIEDLVIGLEAVLPDGEIVRIKNIPRRSTGPDLRQLFIGAEGTLGIITEVTLKIFPKPAEQWMQAYAFDSVRHGLDVIQKFMQAGWKPAVVRLHDSFEASQRYVKYLNKDEAILLLVSEGPEGYAKMEGQALDTIIQAEGGRPLGTEPVKEWFVHRNEVGALEKLTARGMIVDTIEVSAMWGDIANIYEKVITRLKAEVPELIQVAGHASHAYMQGTNLYFVLATKPFTNEAEVERVYWSIWTKVMEITLAYGGSICHHHGIGKLRANWMPEELGSSYKLLETLKYALDPNDIMNKGTLLPTSEKNL